MPDTNLTAGTGIATFGTILALGSYILLQNIPLTAMGIGLIILGIAWALTPPNPLPKNTIIKLIKSSCSNIEALLESIGALEKAVYIPLKNDKETLAYIPIKKSNEYTLEDIANNTGKMIIKLGKSFGVLLTPPKISLNNPYPLTDNTDINNLLEYALIESEIASSVRAVQDNDKIIIEINKPKIDVEYPRFKIIMGSLPSSIAAQAIASAFSKPVQIIKEEHRGNKLIVSLRVLDWTDKTFT